MSPEHDHPHPHPHAHSHSAPGGITLAHAKPVLSVASVPVSLDYYRTVLGFTEIFCWASD